MSLPLLRHTRLSQSLAATRRLASRSRRYSASPVLAEARREPEQRDDDAQVAGPSSSQPASSGADTNVSQAPLKGAQKSSDFTRVQSYLASINASGLEPTREDLERCRPLHQPSPHSPQYTETYTTLINNLCRSFTKEQLRKFLAETLGMSRHSGSHRKKVEYAESIVEQLWGWPTLKELEKAKRDRTEVSIQTFPVSASDLFLFLGPDGTDLLRISKDFDVHISLRREPMALQVEGSRGALREVAERLLILKKSFVEETYDLPFPVAIPPDMVQRISRLASAYLENVPSTPGKLKIVAKGEEGISSAKRLASRAVYEIEESLHTPILTYIPPGAAATHVEQLVMFPHDYALFPYLSPRPLPFTMNTSGTFRLRRAAQWLAADFRERIEHTGGLQGGKGHILTGPEEEGNLKSVLLRGLPSAGQPDQPPIVVKASMGHMLLTRPSGEQRATLVPPLTGAHPFGKVRKWIAQNPVKMTFVPDLPLPLLDVSPLNQSTKHRLVYHALGGGADGTSRETSPKSPAPVRRRKVISLEVTLTKPAAAPQEPRDTMLERDLEEGLSALDFDGSPQTLSAYPALPRVPQIPVLNTAGVHCWTGVEADINLMMPNRPMDLQFTVRSATELAEARQPAELQQYVAQLRAYLKGTDLEADYPSPPLLIENDGERYILHSNTSVRQSEELVSDDVQPTSVDFNPAMEDVTPTRAVCESTLDLETSQKSMHCEVTCPDASSEAAWTQFLRDCDRLSLLREPPPKLYSALQDTQQWNDREMDGDDIL